jgi:SAM-dependent methyltransferase
MNIQHEIISFHPSTGSMLVRYFSEEVPEGLQYAIDIPTENGVYVGSDKINELIEVMKPTGQLERIALCAEAVIPSYLETFVPVSVELDDSKIFETVPAFWGDDAFVPTIGQNGKDVDWTPTPPIVVQNMLEMANVKEGDVVYELGSGTGFLSIEAAKLGATCVGVEYNQALVNLAQRKATAAGVSDRVTFVKGDLLDFDLNGATVVAMYLNENLNDSLREKLQSLPAGTRIVSFIFDIAGWEPTKTLMQGQYLGIYEWTIGA